MILNSTKFGGNRTKDVEVGPDRRMDRQTDRQADSYIPPQTMFAGGIKIAHLASNNNHSLTFTPSLQTTLLTPLSHTTCSRTIHYVICFTRSFDVT